MYAASTWESTAPRFIDSKGKLAKIWRKVRVPGHVEEVLAAAKSL
jgi:peroxiredoxin Q/BCP